MLKSQRLFVHLLVIVMAFSLTSCFHIVEEIFFKKDGSGTYSITLDMSEMASMVAIMSEGEDNEMAESFDGMLKEFEETRMRLETLKGVSNVGLEADKDKLIFTTFYDFEDLDALNLGMNAYSNNQKGTSADKIEFFSYSGGQLTRSTDDLLSDALEDTMNEEGGQDFDPEVLFSDVYFETQLKFERGYRSFSNDQYREVDGNTLSWKKYLFNSRDKDKSLGVMIKTRF